MDLKALKNLFFNFLKQLKEKEVYLLMDYLGTLVQEYEKDYSKLFELINKESNKKLNLFENLMLSIDRSQDIQSNDDQQTANSDKITPNETTETIIPTNEIKTEPVEPVLPKTKINYKKFNLKSQPSQMNTSKRLLRNQAIKKAYFYKETRSKRKSLFNSTLNETMTITENIDNNSQLETHCSNDESNAPALTNSQIKFEIKVENNARYKFNLGVRTYLVSKYQENRYPNSNEIKKIAAHTKLTIGQVFMWFKDMRRKYHHTNPIKFNSDIVDTLMSYYNQNKYPTSDECEKISAKVNLTKQQVLQWFQDKRYRSNQTVKRARYSKEVLDLMRRKFQTAKYPSSSEIEEMMKKTKLSHQQIYVWFKNQRKKSQIN